MRQAQSLLSRIESVPRRELYFFALYRLLEAGILAALMFSPLGEVLGQPRHPELGTAVTIGYLSLALVLFFIGRSVRWLTWIVFASVCIDVAAATLATHALPGATAGIAMMLLFNVSAAALLLPSTRMALAVAALAIVALFSEYFFTTFHDNSNGRSVAEVIMFAVSYLALAYLSALGLWRGERLASPAHPRRRHL